MLPIMPITEIPESSADYGRQCRIPLNTNFAVKDVAATWMSVSIIGALILALAATAFALYLAVLFASISSYVAHSSIKPTSPARIVFNKTSSYHLLPRRAKVVLFSWQTVVEDFFTRVKTVCFI